MNWVKTIWSELIGLFVDDGALAVAVLGWVALSWAVLPRVAAPAGLRPIILFLGLAVILVESALRRARQG